MAKAKSKEKSGEDWRVEFEQAMGESFADCICPPIPLENMMVASCCDVVTTFIGDRVTPTKLAALKKADFAKLSTAFGEYFESKPPSATQIKEAIRVTLARWPVGSLGD